MARRVALPVLVSLVVLLLGALPASARPLGAQAPIAQVTASPSVSPSAPATASPTPAVDDGGPTPAGILVAAVLIGLMLLYRSRVFGRSRPDR
jgi:hypothetical protein